MSCWRATGGSGGAREPRTVGRNAVLGHARHDRPRDRGGAGADLAPGNEHRRPERRTGDGVVVTEKGAPQARTSVLNLIVTVRDRSDSDRVLATLLEMGARHPSRDRAQADPDSDGDPIDARIGTHCRDGENGAGRICFEQLALTVRGEAARHLDGIVAPLVIHDLPIEVWWPGDPPFSDPVFQQLVDLGDRLVINASDFTDLAGGLKRLAAIRRRLGVGDIAWERLAPWHELTAQFFDAPRFRRFLPNLSRLSIKYAVPDACPHRRRTQIAVAGRRGTALCGLDRHSPGVAARRVAGATGGGRDPLSLEGRYEMVELAIEQVPTAAVPPGELSVRLGRMARRAPPSSSSIGRPPRRPW